MATTTKIVLDADVIIHFIKGGQLSALLGIFPEYEYLILDVVYNEVSVNKISKAMVDNLLRFFQHRITMEHFAPTGESRLEYAKLISRLGRGESACMVYCRDNVNVLGSSNLRDIKEYCVRNNITYLTTLDFLYYALIRGKMTTAECQKFISDVNAAGSRIPNIDILHYVPSCML